MRYVRSEGKWKKCVNFNRTEDDAAEKWVWIDCSSLEVPVNVLVDEYEKLIWELTRKEIRLTEVETELADKEFNIKYVEDIDFKELYGKANDDVRKHHVKLVLADLIKQKTDLELSVSFLKREISFLKKVIGIRSANVPSISNVPVHIDFEGDAEEAKRIFRQAVKETVDEMEDKWNG